MTPITNRPVDLISAGTVAAIDSTAPGAASGVAVDELSATLAGRVSPRFGPPHNCHAPTKHAAITNTTTPATAITRRDTRSLGRARCAECRPLRPVVRTGTLSARRAAAANSPAV